MRDYHREQSWHTPSAKKVDFLINLHCISQDDTTYASVSSDSFLGRICVRNAPGVGEKCLCHFLRYFFILDASGVGSFVTEKRTLWTTYDPNYTRCLYFVVKKKTMIRINYNFRKWLYFTYSFEYCRHRSTTLFILAWDVFSQEERSNASRKKTVFCL